MPAPSEMPHSMMRSCARSRFAPLNCGRIAAYSERDSLHCRAPKIAPACAMRAAADTCGT